VDASNLTWLKTTPSGPENKPAKSRRWLWTILLPITLTLGIASAFAGAWAVNFIQDRSDLAH
jgi:hypothetical protein